MFTLWLVAGCIVVAQSYSEHSLMFSYTYMTNPPADKPHFYTERQLNGQTFASYDSWTNASHPEAEWVRRNTSLWTRNNTHSDKHRWFKNNAGALVERLNLSTSDNHVLRWTYGCEARRDRMGRLVFTGIADWYSFDGTPLLEVNTRTLQYEGTDKAGTGAVIAAKWNAILTEKHFDYFHTQCMDILIRAEEAKALFEAFRLQKNTAN